MGGQHRFFVSFTTSSVPAAGDSGDLNTTYYWQKIKPPIHEYDILNNLELVKPGGNESRQTWAGWKKARRFAVPLRADVLLYYYYNILLSRAAALLAGYAIYLYRRDKGADTAAGEDVPPQGHVLRLNEGRICYALWELFINLFLSFRFMTT